MWPLPKQRNEIVTIHLNPQGLTCAWIGPHKGRTPFYVHAYQHTPLNHLEYQGAVIFNITAVKQAITTFLKTHNLLYAFVTMAIEGNAIVEAIVPLVTPSPQAEDFHFPKLKKLIWDFHYLYPTDNAHYAFYVCGMSRQLLAQHQMLALTLPGTITHLTTPTMALLHLYAYIHAAAFRHAQLGKEMEHHNNDINKLFTADTVRRLVTLSSTCSLSLAADQKALLSCLGLFVIERNLSHGTY